MKIIKTKTTATIIKVTDLSPTAREIIFKLDEPIETIPGCFFNIFFPLDGVPTRRAYSAAGDYKKIDKLTIAVRRKDGGAVSPQFWNDDIISTSMEVMGALGINTIDKMHSKKVFLVGYGIGVSVIKALAIGLKDREDIEEVHIITGNRDENDILYKDFFDEIAKTDARFTVRYALAQCKNAEYPYIGFAQNFIDDYNFDGNDVYVCGQEIACNGLVEKVKALTNGRESVNFFIEAFH